MNSTTRLAALNLPWRISASTTGPEDVSWLPVIELPIPERTTDTLGFGISNSGTWLVTKGDSVSSLSDGRVLMSALPMLSLGREVFESQLAEAITVAGLPLTVLAEFPIVHLIMQALNWETAGWMPFALKWIRLSEVRADRRNNLDMSRRVRYCGSLESS